MEHLETWSRMYEKITNITGLDIMSWTVIFELTII